MVDEIGVVRGGRRGKDRDLISVDGAPMPNGTTRMKASLGQGHSARSTKHGSFDFERPGWSAAGVMQRSGSTGTGSGTSETGTSGGWGRDKDGFLGGVRESAMGPGLAGVGTLQRDQSVKRAKERDEMILRARGDERRKREKEKERHPQRLLSRTSPLPDTDENGVGTSTSTTGKSSSLGRKRGGLLREGSARGKPRVAPLGVAHGRFAFEPPVPSPTRSTTSTNTNTGPDAQLSVSWAGERGKNELEKENARVKEEMEREKHREKERKRQSYRDRAPVPVPSVGHRSGAKGRSLDLGLGLAWAPTKLREDALLPSSGFFARSHSGSSSHGVDRSVSGSTNASGSGRAEDKSKVGREIADVFRNALDDEGYVAFKKCMSPSLYIPPGCPCGRLFDFCPLPAFRVFTY